jgi:hypothetical protein
MMNDGVKAIENLGRFLSKIETDLQSNIAKLPSDKQGEVKMKLAELAKKKKELKDAIDNIK